MFPKIVKAARGALDGAVTPDLQTYAGGGLVALGLGVWHVAAGLVAAGVIVGAGGMLRDIERAARGTADRS